MTTVYRTAGAWGAGKGSALTKVEVDTNFYGYETRIAAIEGDLPDVARSIDSIDISGTTLTITYTDATFDVVEVPYVVNTLLGEWTAATSYVTTNRFTNNGNLYEVLFDHVSEATFDAGANDGLGNDYYGLIMSNPGASLPSGGATGQVMEKASGADYAFTFGWKLPTGGASRQYLIKQTSGEQDADWDDPLATDIVYVPPTSSTLTADNVQDAIDELETAVTGVTVDAASVEFTPTIDSDLTSDDVAEALEELEVLISTKADASEVVGRQTLWIPATSMIPQITNGPVGETLEMTTNDNMVSTLKFDATTVEKAQFTIAMPKSWNLGNLFFQPYWSHDATTVNFDVVWGLEAVAMGNNEVLDVSFGGGASFVTDTGGSTDRLYIGDESTAFAAQSSPADGNLILFRIFRLPTSGSDTMAIDARLHGVKIIYLTNAATDA